MTLNNDHKIDWLILLIVMLVLMLVTATPSIASERQSLASIKMQTEKFIEQYPYESPYPPRYVIRKLDSRLRLAACDKDLTIIFANPARRSGNTAVTVSCSNKPSWKIHLPVNIELFDDVMVTTKPHLRGQNIDTAALKLKKRVTSSLNQGYFNQSENFSQLQAKRNLPSGTVLTPANLVLRMMVRSGQKVTLVLQYKGLQVRSSGRALRSAGLGQIVKVRNNQSNKIVEGVVSGDAQVTVNI